jgi:hypothetical protein
MLTNETQDATSTALRSRFRDICSANGIREDKGCEDVERCLLAHWQQCRKSDLLWLFLKYLDDRCFFDFVFVQKLLEHKRLKYAQTNPQANPNQDDR